jgi:heme A synthase
LCRGALIPNSTEVSTYINWFHRFFALMTGVVLAYTTLVAWRGKDQQHSAWIMAALMLSFFVIQAAIGGAVVLSQIHLVWRGFHLAMAAATWTAAIVLVVLAARSGQPQTADSHQTDRASSSRSVGGAPAVSESPLTRKQIIGAYVKLSKPWVIVLLLVTTFAAMLIAQRGLPPLPLVFFTLLGGALSAAGASAINSYIDRRLHEPHQESAGSNTPYRRR